MHIADSIIKQKLRNVYFIWGRGKTTIANHLQKKYGFYIYRTDDSRNWHMRNANSIDQPYMCRNFVKEYGVKSFWELPSEVIAEREQHFVAEMTPMIIADLMALSSQHEIIICEGDIDYEAVAPVATHAVHLCNSGSTFDWFNRPDHIDAIHAIEARIDLSEEEKADLIRHAYEIVATESGVIPEWVTRLGIKNISWNDTTTIEQTTLEVANYFEFGA